MRLSTDPQDPGYPQDPAERRRMHRAKVFFQGYERSHVITADEEQRLIVVHAIDAEGYIRLNKERTQQLRETLYGDVRIELPGSNP